MYEFPEQQDTLDNSLGIIGNRECGICFSEKSENDELPNKICNNEKCMKHFHSACLMKVRIIYYNKIFCIKYHNYVFQETFKTEKKIKEALSKQVILHDSSDNII